MFDTVIEVIQRGRTEIFRCPFHNDGEDRRNWSAVGYPDGKFYCYACKARGSIVDLAIYLDIGRMNRGEKIVERDIDGRVVRILDKEMHEAYKRHGHLLDNKSALRPLDPSRSFTELESLFLTDVACLMNDWLAEDREAKNYLKGRGVDPAWSIFGVARPGQMGAIHEIARSYDDEDLPRRVGLESRHPNYIGKMYYGVMDSVVAFHRDSENRVVYYQARTLRKDREHNYYNPERITKIPIEFGEGPLLIAEGFFKVAWAAVYGFRAVGMTGNFSDHLPESLFQRFNNQIYLADNDQGPGIRAARIMLNRVELLGNDHRLCVLMPPDPHKDGDTWAKDVGYKTAALDIWTQYNRFQNKASLPLT